MPKVLVVTNKETGSTKRIPEGDPKFRPAIEAVTDEWGIAYEVALDSLEQGQLIVTRTRALELVTDVPAPTNPMVNYGIIKAVDGPRGDDLERIKDMQFADDEAARSWASGVSYGGAEFGGGISIYGIFNRDDWPEESAAEIGELLGLTD